MNIFETVLNHIVNSSDVLRKKEMKKKMQTKDKRKCIACGKYHDGKECPLIKAKMDKFYKQKATNFLMGNIFFANSARTACAFR